MLISNIILQGSTYFFNLHFIFIFVTLLSPRAHHNIQCNITAIDLSKIKHFLNQFVCNSFRFVKQLLWANFNQGRIYFFKAWQADFKDGLPMGAFWGKLGHYELLSNRFVQHLPHLTHTKALSHWH